MESRNGRSLLRKDKLPSDTIQSIKQILKSHSINVTEKKCFKISNNIFSVRIELKELPGIGANGKGISKSYALASAYAELMERLQSRLLIKPYYLNKLRNIVYFTDELLMDYDEFEVMYDEFFKNVLADKFRENLLRFVKDNEDYRIGADFVNPISNQVQKLPIRIINSLTHSNGLCAGNTYEEAVVQGICEIFERFCYRKILFEELELPTIQSIEDTYSCYILDQLLKLGYSYCVKDCSLGIYPVVGLIIYNQDKTKYLFSIGADPDFDIALQRCITEVFQGSNMENFKSKMKDVKNTYYSYKIIYSNEFISLNWLKCYSSNNGIHPKSIFKTNTIINSDDLPFIKKTNISNKECLNFLFNIISENDLNIFIKDYSFLNFPTYRVYIPGLSEVSNLDDLGFEILSSNSALNNIYFNLLSCQIDSKSIDTLKKMAKAIIYSEFIIPSNYFNIKSYINSNIKQLNYFHILSLVLLKNKMYQDLKELCSDNYFSDQHEDFTTLILSMINEPDDSRKELQINKFIKTFSFPSCPDCDSCLCKKSCKYNEWSRLNDLLNKKYEIWNYARENIFIKQLKPEITQCRIIQLEKKYT